MTMAVAAVTVVAAAAVMYPALPLQLQRHHLVPPCLRPRRDGTSGYVIIVVVAIAIVIIPAILLPQNESNHPPPCHSRRCLRAAIQLVVE